MMFYGCVIVAVLMASVIEARATTYFVNKSGSDANSCATAQSDGASAKLTIGSGLSCATAANGDIVSVGDGVYVEQVVSSQLVAGTTFANAMTLKSTNLRGATLRPSGTSDVLDIDCNTEHHVIFDGLVLDAVNTTHTRGVVKIHGFTDACKFAHHIRIIRSEIMNTNTSAIQVATFGSLHASGDDGGYNEFIDNIVHNNGADSFANAFYIQSGHHVITGNTCYDNVGTCIALSQQNAGYPEFNVIERNRIYGNGVGATKGYGILLAGAQAANNTISRNVVYSSVDRDGIDLVESGPVNNFVYNNTVYGNAGGGILMAGSGNIARNNIVFGNTGTALTCGASNTCSNNTTADPSYVDAATANFNLSIGSVAIDAGIDVSLGFNGSAPDTGAFETIVHATCSVESGDASNLRITYTSNVRPPLLPASSITGFTARADAVNNPVTAANRVGDNRVDLTLTSAITGGQAVDYTYSTSTGNVTDSSLIGATLNQRLNGITNQSCVNNVSGAPSHVFTQTYSRWHGLYGTEAAPVVKPFSGAPANTNIQIVVGGKARIRLKVACTTADCPAIGMNPRYSRNSGSYTVIPDAFGADNIRFLGTGADPDIPTSGTTTTELLTSDHATNVACSIVRTSNAIPTVDLALNSETECEYAIELDTDAVMGDTYDLRLYDQGGAALNAYAATPRMTVTGMVAAGGN